MLMKVSHLNVPHGYHLHFQDHFNLETTREINIINILVPSNTRIILLFRATDGIYETSFNNSEIQRLIITAFHIIDYYLLVHEKDINISKDVFNRVLSACFSQLRQKVNRSLVNC